LKEGYIRASSTTAIRPPFLFCAPGGRQAGEIDFADRLLSPPLFPSFLALAASLGRRRYFRCQEDGGPPPPLFFPPTPDTIFREVVKRAMHSGFPSFLSSSVFHSLTPFGVRKDRLFLFLLFPPSPFYALLSLVPSRGILDFPSPLPLFAFCAYSCNALSPFPFFFSFSDHAAMAVFS